MKWKFKKNDKGKNIKDGYDLIEGKLSKEIEYRHIDGRLSKKKEMNTVT